jgi:hypothetical protein
MIPRLPSKGQTWRNKHVTSDGTNLFTIVQRKKDYVYYRNAMRPTEEPTKRPVYEFIEDFVCVTKTK